MLVYVDGFEAPIESLSTAEIESVTLLKDASALALYGMRGANGVLLVTTKKDAFPLRKSVSVYKREYNNRWAFPILSMRMIIPPYTIRRV